MFQGPLLGKATSGVLGKNSTRQKMSFATAIVKVFFDVGNVGYWSDMNNLLTGHHPSPWVPG